MQNFYSYTINNKISFDQNIIIEYNNQQIDYLVPKEEKLYLLEGLWGSPLAFSNLSFDDFLFIYFSILLENPIVFVSQNVCLLTLTMLIINKYLKLFNFSKFDICRIAETIQMATCKYFQFAVFVAQFVGNSISNHYWIERIYEFCLTK